jgi:hypothetical protein
MEHIQFLSFVVADLKRTRPIRLCIFGDGPAAVSTDSGFRESFRGLRRVIELSLMSLVPMLFADDGASSDKPVSLILAGQFADEDRHKNLQISSCVGHLHGLDTLREKASCASVIDPSSANIPATTRIPSDG